VSATSVQRLIFWNRLWLCLLLVGALLEGTRWLFTRFDVFLSTLRPVWSASGLRLVTSSDGPFVVTHLVLSEPEAGSEKGKAVAQLARPIVIMDSDGASIPSAELHQLTWRNIFGQSVPPPPDGAPIRALYYRPLTTPSAADR
jgi:hypothetical protein